MVGRVVAEAASRAGCGLVDLLCSGYNPGVEEIGLYAILSGELGLEFPFKEEFEPASGEGLIDETGRVIREVGAALRGYWSLG